MISKTIQLYANSISGFSRQIWLLSLVTFINRCGTMVIPFLSVYMTSRLGFTLEDTGYVLLFFGIGSVAGSFLGGKLTDIIGYYWVLALSLFFGGAMFIGLGMVDSFWGVGLMVFLAAAIGDAYRPAVMTAVAVYSQPENRTRAFSLLRMAINFGWAIGPALGGLIVATTGEYGPIFWVDGFTCMAAAIVFGIYLREKKKPAEDNAEALPPAPASSPYKDVRYLFFMGLTIIGMLAFMQFMYTLPVFYKESMQMSEGEIGLILAMNGFLIFFIEMPMVYTLERKFKLLHNVAIGCFLYGVAFFMLNLAEGRSIAIAFCSMLVLSVGEIFNMPFTNAYAMSRSNEQNRGAYMGVFTMAYSVAHIIGPPLGTKAAAHWGFDGLWYLVGSLAMISFFGTLLLEKWDERRKGVPMKEKLIQVPETQTGE